MDPPPQAGPIGFLKEAIKAVPAVKYALGVGGVVSIIAIVGSFGILQSRSDRIPGYPDFNGTARCLRETSRSESPSFPRSVDFPDVVLDVGDGRDRNPYIHKRFL